ncbi:hypothetical protein ACN28S_16480 [Cystobacter fuscus]
MKRAVAVGLGWLCITCTVPDLDELEAERPSSCDADHPCQVRVLLSYDGFRPGCVTLRLADAEAPRRRWSSRWSLRCWREGHSRGGLHPQGRLEPHRGGDGLRT